MESHLEARLWKRRIPVAQDLHRHPARSIRATVLIETILAAFEMDEILYELREHSSGLNCGRWDTFSASSRNSANRPDFLLPDRAQVTMDRDFLKLTGPVDSNLSSPGHSRHGRHGGADSHQE